MSMLVEHSTELPFIVAVGGFTSNAGKTTLVCELLGAMAGRWEAIKVTRGHYRSCGKDPHACCVSHLLGDAPLVRSGRAETYAPGKDTGRYWDAGAANVHWVIATSAQVEAGVRGALGRVRSPGVLIEGNSFLKSVAADFVVVAANVAGDEVKPTARRALMQADAVYLFSAGGADAAGVAAEGGEVEKWRRRLRLTGPESERLGALPVFTRADLPVLADRVRGSALAGRARGQVLLEQ
jgi:molybdopterin-guanine dinucleotide biosynthesis protein